MPATARKLGVNPYHLDGNIRGGLMYYKMLYKMFGSQELALAAYHTGPAYVLKYKQPAPCSRRYVAAIMQDYHRIKGQGTPAVKKQNTQTHAQAQVQAESAKKQAEDKAKAEAKAKADAEAKAKYDAERRAIEQAAEAERAHGLHEADAKTIERVRSEV